MSNENQTTSSTAVAGLPAPKKEPGFFGRHKKKFMIGAGIAAGAGLGYFLWTKTSVGEVSESMVEKVQESLG